MIYGLYLSATGVVANSYRQDVIANNLANAETAGFKRDIPVFQQRLTEARSRAGGMFSTNASLEPLGGGFVVAPTVVDRTRGELEPTGAPGDVAIDGEGYFMVDSGGKQMLTRDGRMMVDRQGRLIWGTGAAVLDAQRKEIVLDPTKTLAIGEDGTITQDGKGVARLGVFMPGDADRLSKAGGNLLNDPGIGSAVAETRPVLRSGFIERSNVDPTTELTELMDAQRQLEANANMIRYQDQALSRLVNEVGKIG